MVDRKVSVLPAALRPGAAVPQWEGRRGKSKVKPGPELSKQDLVSQKSFLCPVSHALSHAVTSLHFLSPFSPTPSHTLLFFFFERYPNSGLRPPYLHTFSGQKLQVCNGQGVVQTKGTLQVTAVTV